jgi:hypothetical protein
MARPSPLAKVVEGGSALSAEALKDEVARGVGDNRLLALSRDGEGTWRIRAKRSRDKDGESSVFLRSRSESKVARVGHGEEVL